MKRKATKAPKKPGPKRRKKGPQRRSPLDDIFSRLVRERAEWRCERCGEYHPEGMRMKLHCSHFFSRSRQSVRFHPLNAAAHCAKCHWHLSHSPLEFGRWIDEHLAYMDSRKLEVLANQTCKRSAADKADLLSEMKAQLAFMQSERAKGVTGRIEFEL